MADYLEFEGRFIEDVPFTGLLESITKIGLLATTALELAEHLSKEDLVNILGQLRTEQVNSAMFSGATDEELSTLNRHLMLNMTTDFKPGH